MTVDSPRMAHLADGHMSADKPYTPSAPGPSTLYMPVLSPPTPAPSPRLRPSSSVTSLPLSPPPLASPTLPSPLPALSPFAFSSLTPTERQAHLAALLTVCTPSELLFVSTFVAPRLKRDFLAELPPELALYVLSFVHDARTLARVAQVSRCWRALARDDALWRELCVEHGFRADTHGPDATSADPGASVGNGSASAGGAGKERDRYSAAHMPPRPAAVRRVSSFSTLPEPRSPELHCRQPSPPNLSHRELFQHAYETLSNWRTGGTCLRTHRVPVLNPDSGVVTSVALDADWLVAGLANHRIHVFSARTGLLVRSLVGHELGVWAVNLVSRGGAWAGPYECEGSSAMGMGGASMGMSGASMGMGMGVGVGVGTGGRTALRTELRDTFESVLRHNRAPAGSNTQDPQGLDGLLTPAMRLALGLDQPKRYAQCRPMPAAAADVQDPEGQEDDIDGEEEGEEDREQRARLKQLDSCGASEGWGQPGALVVSGGCDKVLRVWDVNTGHCIYVLQGHTSTVRCLKVLHNRPIAVSGSRDATLRVWDVQKGRMLKVLRGHTQSIRALDAYGNQVVTGSYDCTCRLWDVDTGECLQVFRGHFHQIYSVAYDGVRIASGGLDTTVRLWDAHTGQCLALLQGHTALVCQLQLSPTLLATGGADGRVITFSLPSYTVQHRIAAHDSSVTSLQFDDQFLVTGGNDGRVRLWDLGERGGNYIRDLTEVSEIVWKVVFRREGCAVLCKRAGKTVVEIWSFRPRARKAP